MLTSTFMIHFKAERFLVLSFLDYRWKKLRYKGVVISLRSKSKIALLLKIESISCLQHLYFILFRSQYFDVISNFKEKTWTIAVQWEEFFQTKRFTIRLHKSKEWYFKYLNHALSHCWVHPLPWSTSWEQEVYWFSCNTRKYYICLIVTQWAHQTRNQGSI